MERNKNIKIKKISGEKSDFSNSKAVYKLKHFPCKCIFSLAIIRSPVRSSSGQSSTHLQHLQHSANRAQAEQRSPQNTHALSKFPRLTKPRRLLQALPCFPKNLQADTAGTGQDMQGCKSVIPCPQQAEPAPLNTSSSWKPHRSSEAQGHPKNEQVPCGRTYLVVQEKGL